MKLKHGYDFGEHFHSTYLVVEDEGEAEIITAVDNVKTETGRASMYGTTIHMKDGEIVAFTIRSFDIELRIPATIRVHNAIQNLFSVMKE